MKRLLPISVVCSLLALLAVPAVAGAALPARFFGTTADGPLVGIGPHVDVAREFRTMAQAGVETVRASFYWANSQPYRTFSDAPASKRRRFRDVDGVPTDFSESDRIVAEAARNRLTVLPVVLVAPRWAARHPGIFTSPPSDDAAYARYVAALIHRYGPHGSFWKENRALPKLAIRDWQIWNEPNFFGFWSDRPYAADYVALMRATRPLLKAADPGARLILGGLPEDSWNALGQLYAAGARGLFDAAAIHPFTQQVGGVVQILTKARQVMRDNGDGGLPVIVSELSWPSARGRSSEQPPYVVTAQQQGTRVTEAYRRLTALRRRLGIESIYWYTWITTDDSPKQPFFYSGLRRADRHGRVISKPAFTAFTHVVLGLEGRPHH